MFFFGSRLNTAWALPIRRIPVRTPEKRPPPQYCVAYADGSHEKWYKTPEDTLDYRVGEDRLGDIITKAIVTYRTL